MSKVIIADVNGDLDSRVEYVFEQLVPGISGRKVLLKPNIMTSTPPEAGVTTHPEVVRAVVRAALRRGAQVMVGDNPGGVDRNSLWTAKKCGIYEASEGCFVNLSQEVVEIPADSQYSETLVISKAILEADYIINLPIFKTHTLTTITGAIKNCYGYIAGSCKAQLHLKAPGHRRFPRMLIDIYAKRPPDLHLLDALTVMEGNGPSHGQVRPLGKILASNDGVALDATMARMIGVDPSSLYFLQVAQERGLGTYEAAEIEIDGKLEAIPDFKLPTTFTAAAEERAAVVQTIGSIRPLCFVEKCTRCRRCEINCPPKAITMSPYPVIDNEKCISCYCCTELCPEGAVEVPEGKPQSLFDQIMPG
ncbi:MAG: DUF362 domain-containing protein [Chloroflexi bacterium]|nr:DUF362 domain-containing protein [Chloroflexota bacterium]